MPRYERLVQHTKAQDDEWQDAEENPVLSKLLQKQSEMREGELRRFKSLIELALTAYQGNKEEIRTFFEKEIYTLPNVAMALVHRLIDSAQRNTDSEREGEEAAAREIKKIHDTWSQTRSHNKYEVMKSGNMSLFLSRDWMVFERKLPSESVEAWERAAQVVPIEPIVKMGPLDSKGEESVYSRYCGLMFNSVYGLFEDTIPELAKDLAEQRYAIIEALGNNGIVHGHLHGNNFTVEFIRKDAVRSLVESPGVIEDFEHNIIRYSHLINTFPYTPDNIVFDPVEAVRRKDEFVPIVRVIDFDLAYLPSRRGVQVPASTLEPLQKNLSSEDYAKWLDYQQRHQSSK